MTKIIKKPLSILLAALMIVSLFAAVPMTVNAAPPGGTGGGITVDPIAVTTGSEFATAPTAINGLVANGTDQALINEGTTSAGTAYYYMTTEDITGEQANSLFDSPSKPGSFSTSIPKGTDAGTYYVWYAIDGGSNYEDLLPYMEINNQYESHKLTVTIAAPTYTVTWKNWNGDVLETDTDVAEGTTPTYDGTNPEKAEDANYTYTFAGWSDGTNTYAANAIPAVTADVTYTATYTATAKTKPWTYEITTGGEYTCPSTLSRNTIVSGGTEENPVIINITGQTTVQAPIYLRSGYLKIVGNNNTVEANRGFVLFTGSGSYKPNGDAHLTITDLSFSSTNASNQYIQINSQNYKCQSTFENVTFKNCNINGSGAVVIGSETTHTLKNCTFEDNTGYNAGGISFRYGSDVTMEGCTFKNCTRTRPYSTSFLGGGAVWVQKDSKLTLDDCTFENCTGECGAIGIESDASLTLKGNTTITGNANGNLYLPTGATFNVAEDFTGTVGVTTQTAPTDSASVLLAIELADTQAALANKNIVSDNENYGVIYKDNSLFLINSKVYTVTWKNDDGTVLKTEALAEGTTPTYTGENPEKAEDENNTYTFSGWTPEITAVTGDAEYTATFTAVPKYDYITNGDVGYKFLDAVAKGVDDALADKNNYTSLCNFKLLGVQKKVESDELDSESKTDVRFVSVVKTDILRDADEYGYVFAKVDNKEFARNNAYRMTVDAENVLVKKCTESSNTISGDYGKYDANTDYKYVTASVNGIGNDTVAARFYIKKGDKYYYADYTNKDNETYTVCATAFSDLG